MKMKPAITITTTILVSVMAAGLASAQSPRIIQNTRETMNGVQHQQQEASNQALRARDTARPTERITHPPGKNQQQTSSAPRPPQARVPSASSGERRASAKGSSHHKGHWVHGVWVEEFVPGITEGQQTPGQQTQDQQAEDAQAEPAPSAYAGNGAESEQNVAPDSKSAANGRRDPFISPVVSHAGGSGCSTGKKCLEIGAINLRGVVRAESGFIAVVSNGMNKAYFLRENDPVFNGYVVKITGDSIVFQETLQDRLGKTFTREVVKKITTPAV
jgi:hypothetical protein